MLSAKLVLSLSSCSLTVETQVFCLSPSHQHNVNRDFAFAVTCAVSNAASMEDITPSTLSIFVIVHMESLAAVTASEADRKEWGSRREWRRRTCYIRPFLGPSGNRGDTGVSSAEVASPRVQTFQSLSSLFPKSASAVSYSPSCYLSQALQQAQAGVDCI